MNWSCPNQIDGHCEKLEKPCHPVQEGCVLEGKVKVIGKEEQIEENDEDGFFEGSASAVVRADPLPFFPPYGKAHPGVNAYTSAATGIERMICLR